MDDLPPLTTPARRTRNVGRLVALPADGGPLAHLVLRHRAHRHRRPGGGPARPSSPEDDIRIGATGTTRQEAEESYAAHRAVWQGLRHTRVTEIGGQPVTADRDPSDRDGRASLIGPDPEAVLRVAAAGVKST